MSDAALPSPTPAPQFRVVIPLIVEANVLGVLDLDSPRLGRFDREDARGLEEFVKVLLTSSDLGELSAIVQPMEPAVPPR